MKRAFSYIGTLLAILVVPGAFIVFAIWAYHHYRRQGASEQFTAIPAPQEEPGSSFRTSEQAEDRSASPATNASSLAYATSSSDSAVSCDTGGGGCD